MPAPGIVEALDVIEHIGLGLRARAVQLRGRALRLQRGEEAFHHRIVPDVARPTHAAGNAVISEESLEGLTGVLAASIRVMQDGLGLAPSPNRHHEGIGDELRGHCGMHGPADDPSREEIDARGHVEPAFGGPEIREVGDPFAVGQGGVERSIENIRRDRVRRAHPGVRGHPSPSGAGAQRGVAHQSLNAMETTREPLHQHIVPDPPGSVGAIAGEEAGSHSGQQLLIGHPPGIETCARHRAPHITIPSATFPGASR